jgi:hypothetical protein
MRSSGTTGKPVSDAIRRAGLLLAPLALLLVGCSDDDTGPLAEDQLPSEVVESETRTGGAPTATSCADLNQAQLHLSVSAGSDVDDPSRYWTYRLDDGTWVLVHVMEIGTPVSDGDQALDEVAEAIESCSGESDAGEVSALDDAPDDSVGYRSTTTDSNGTREAETLVATAGDRIVMVVASRDQGTEPSVDVRDLLDDVRDAAADIDLG